MNGNKLWNNLQPLRHSLYHLHEYNLWLESRNNKLFYYECKLYLYMKFYWMWQKGLEGAVNSMYLNKKSYSEWFLPWWVQFPGILNVIFKVHVKIFCIPPLFGNSFLNTFSSNSFIHNNSKYNKSEFSPCFESMYFWYSIDS